MQIGIAKPAVRIPPSIGRHLQNVICESVELKCLTSSRDLFVMINDIDHASQLFKPFPRRLDDRGYV